MNTTTSIPTLESREAPSDYASKVAENQPFIVRSGIAHWRAYECWSFEYLCGLYGNLHYDCQVALPTGVPTLHLAKDFTRRMSLREFVQVLRDASFDSPCYMHQRPLAQFPGLDADLLFEEFTGPLGKDPFINLWIGSAGTKSSLHFDFQNGFLAQIRGRKRFFLVDPRYSSKLAPIPGVIQKSRVDPENPDFETFPASATVPLLVAEVGPGDIIYIPAGWWHAVRGLEPYISINCFFGPNMGASRRLRYAAVSGPRTWVAVIQDFFRHGVFGVELPGRLYSAEPFGLWFYNEMVGFLRRRHLLPNST